MLLTKACPTSRYEYPEHLSSGIPRRRTAQTQTLTLTQTQTRLQAYGVQKGSCFSWEKLGRGGVCSSLNGSLLMWVNKSSALQLTGNQVSGKEALWGRCLKSGQGCDCGGIKASECQAGQGLGTNQVVGARRGGEAPGGSGEGMERKGRRGRVAGEDRTPGLSGCLWTLKWTE